MHSVMILRFNVVFLIRAEVRQTTGWDGKHKNGKI